MVKVNSSEEINMLQKNLAELQTSRMQWNKYSYIAGTPSTRLERLLRERELRKLNRSFPQSEEVRDWNREVDQCLTEIDNWPPEEELLQGFAVGRRLSDGFERQDRQPPKQRLLVVANRLPVSAVRRGEDSWALEISVGGLVSALLGVNEFEARRIGWAGVNVPDEIGQRTLTKALAEKRCIPVFLDEEIVHQYYNGYCNNILWPFFHYLGLPQEDRLATTRSFQSQFDAYKKANQMFADVVNEHYEEGDIVWCRDYRLMFLPKCLKEYNNKMKVGWFLHTPFPSSEIHKTLPSRSELLRSVLAADLVGFHTYDYARHFVSACTCILGLEGTRDGVEDQGKLTRVAAIYILSDDQFPIGIDSDRFILALELPQVQDHIKEVKERFAGRKFAGAAQSLGAGAILVNPWNITEVAASIGYALNMPADEREKRHHHNFMHVTTHTSQEWAETFVSELNDIIVEAQLRIRQIPPFLPVKVAIERYLQSNNRLLILGFLVISSGHSIVAVIRVHITQGFNATLTEPLDAQGRRGDQLKEMEPKLHPDLKESLRKLSEDPKTAIIILSGSDRTILDENFGKYMWLAAEHGMLLRLTKGNWMTTMPENLHRDWVDSVKHVFEFSLKEHPGLILSFGRLHFYGITTMQHLWTGPISNASVDVIQGRWSVEVRAVGVTKGAEIDCILGEIVHSKGMKTPIDYVLCIGHFLAKDEDIYTFFEPELLSESATVVRANIVNHVKTSASKLLSGKSGPKASQYKVHRPLSTLEKRLRNHGNEIGWRPKMHDQMSVHEGSSVLDLRGDNYFSCAVGQKRSNARYLLGSSTDVVSLFNELALVSSSS